MRSAITHGGVNQVITARRSSGDLLVVTSWRVNADGSISFQNSLTDTAVRDVSIVRYERLGLITATREYGGLLRVTAWNLRADGSLQRLAHVDGG